MDARRFWDGGIVLSIYLRPLKVEDAETILAMERKNRDFFSQYAPDRAADFYTLKGHQSRL